MGRRHALIDTHMHQTLNTKNFEYLTPYRLRKTPRYFFVLGLEAR